MTMNDTVVSSNSAGLRGSGIFMNTAPDVKLLNNTFTNNDAEDGATIYSFDS